MGAFKFLVLVQSTCRTEQCNNVDKVLNFGVVKKNKKISVRIFIALGLCAPFHLFAEISASLTATTSYVSRGYSKSDSNPALQGNIDYEHSSGLYLGVWTSNVDFDDSISNDPARIEVSPYLGWSFELSDDWRLDTQVTSYIYDGKIFGESSDYHELDGFLHFRDLLTFRAAYSEDAYSQSTAAYDFELAGRYPVTDSLEFSTGFGYALTRDVIEYDYYYWDAGFTWYYKYVALDFRYTDSDQASEKEDEANVFFEFEPLEIDPSFVFTISIGF